MGYAMKTWIGLLQRLPRSLQERLPAMGLSAERKAAGSKHPRLRLNLQQQLICARHCGTCPSHPKVAGESFYCATGASTATVEARGCNCVQCELLEHCRGQHKSYFCRDGADVWPHPPTRRARQELDLIGQNQSYLERFLPSLQGPSPPLLESTSPESKPTTESGTQSVTMQGEGSLTVAPEQTLLQAVLAAGIHQSHVCGGRARCSTCRVLVLSGLEHCTPRNEQEARLAQSKNLVPEVRLACQTKIRGPVSVRRLVLDQWDIRQAIEQGPRHVEAGREVEASILFSDIRSFTSFSEQALPYDIIHILNRYFETIGQIIDEHGGYIDKYMGDGIMVIFGLDRSETRAHQQQAVQAALRMLQALEEFNHYLQQYFSHQFRIGVGIHSGTVIVGRLGFRKKQELTAIGDTVNTASRVESMTKELGAQILVSDRTHAAVAEEFIWGKQESVRLKGKQQALVVHELLGTRAPHE